MTELHRGEFEALNFTRHAAAAAAAAGLGRPSTLNLETEAKTDGGAVLSGTVTKEGLKLTLDMHGNVLYLLKAHVETLKPTNTTSVIRTEPPKSKSAQMIRALRKV